MSNSERFEHYEVLKRPDGSLFELGRGAMGITYKALDTDLRCFVALKIINSATIANADAEERFFREARSAAQLRHPNIASVFRLGKTENGTHYYAMEFCEGKTLQQIVDEGGPLECRRALEFTLQIAKALVLAEEDHLVHRDLKPSNLIVTNRSDEGEVIKVIDFGLAKSSTSEGTMWSSMGTCGFIGTAHFASPEQIEDKPVDTRSDIYSLGSTLWFMLLGRPPFEGSLPRIMSQHLTTPPDFSALKGFPEEVVAMLQRMLEKEPALRQQSAKGLLGETRACLKALEHWEEQITSLGVETVAPSAPAPAPLSENGNRVPDPPPGIGVRRSQVFTLLDPLRVRGALAPVEVLRLGDVLLSGAHQDAVAGASHEGLLQHVIIHFQHPESIRDPSHLFRARVTDWPPFELEIKADDIQTKTSTVIVDHSMTVVPTSGSLGDPVQDLARLFYQLLGGVSGARYVPVASLGEGGNAVLQPALSLGTALHSNAREFVDALRSATAGAPPPSPFAAPFSSSAVKPSEPPEPLNKPLAAHDAVPSPAAPSAPRSPVWPETQPPPAPVHPPKAKSIRIVKWVKLGTLVMGVAVFMSMAYALRSNLGLKIRNLYTILSRREEKPIPGRFWIDFDLRPSAGQISKKVSVYLDNQDVPVFSGNLDAKNRSLKAMIKAGSGGEHTIAIRTVLVVANSSGKTRNVTGFGQTNFLLRGNEWFAATEEIGAPDTYEVKITFFTIAHIYH